MTEKYDIRVRVLIVWLCVCECALYHLSKTEKLLKLLSNWKLLKLFTDILQLFHLTSELVG